LKMKNEKTIGFDIIALSAERERESTLRVSLHQGRLLRDHHDPLRDRNGTVKHHLAQTLPDDGDHRNRVKPLMKIWKSHQNGWVYDTQGLCPTLTVGQHSGVEPKIIEYDN